MANERPMGLRNNDKKIDENWNKIDWSKSSTTAEEAETDIINQEMKEAIELNSNDGVEGYKELYTIDYEDGDKQISYAMAKRNHVFVLRDVKRASEVLVIANPNSPLTDALLGIMNELHTLKHFELLGRQDVTTN